MKHLESKPAAPSRCARCGAELLTGRDEGLLARVDAQPVDQAAEIDALLDGRWTYTLTFSKDLIHRDAHRIAADTIPGQIHAEHKCETNEGKLF